MSERAVGRPLAVSTPAQSASLGALLRRLALSACLSTLALIMLGSFVRASGNGLGCPDWPLCYGQAVPPLRLSAWIEFSHRLFGGLVALQILALAAVSGRLRALRPATWRLSLAAVVLLVLQVGLGGLHVLNELPRWTGLIHTGVALALLGLLAALVALTGPANEGSIEAPPGERGGLARLAVGSAGATYLLLLSGSLVTRTGSSLACPGFPACGLTQVSAALRPFVEVQMTHRLGALPVAGLILAVAWSLWRSDGARPAGRLLAVSLGVLLALQIGLGAANVLLGLPIWSRVLHLGTGASLWALLVFVAVRLRPPAEKSPALA
ncbi:MAG: COX15/CtaA family protein [Candidatus Promineifilaceae bacterium]